MSRTSGRHRRAAWIATPSWAWWTCCASWRAPPELDRFGAQALLAERARAQMASLKVTESTDVRILVPLGPVLFARLRPLVDRTDDVVYDLSAIVLDTVLAYATTRPDLAPAAVAEVALRLIPSN